MVSVFCVHTEKPFISMNISDAQSVSIHPTNNLKGTIVLPGDKSISHRAAIIASLATGRTSIENFSTSQDCNNTLDCLSQLGVKIHKNGTLVDIEGSGLKLKKPQTLLNAGNSGTTIRLLAGVLSGQSFESCLTGDSSLLNRPMERIITPLQKMGANIKANDQYPPLIIRGNNLQPITYSLPIPSAQVKSSILLAGLFSAGKTTVIELIPTRDHTERILRMFGAPIEVDQNSISIIGNQPLQAPSKKLLIPGDFSSAAFFIAAAALVSKADITLKNVGINSTRTGLLEIFKPTGLNIEFLNKTIIANEPVADIHISHNGKLECSKIKIQGSMIPSLIDEIPILAILGAHFNGIEVREAQELRVKESDRIKVIVQNLRQMGATVFELEDGFYIEKKQYLEGAIINSNKDHRIAMAFSIAALAAKGTTQILDANCTDISFPNFYKVLQKLYQS